MFGVIQQLLFGQLALFLLFNTTFFWNAILDIYSNVLDCVLRVQIPWIRIASKHEGFCRVWAGLDVGVVQVQVRIVDYGVLYDRIYVIDVAVVVRVKRVLGDRH